MTFGTICQFINNEKLRLHRNGAAFFLSSSDAVDNFHVGERHGSAWSLSCGIHGVGLPPLYIFHELAVVVVCRAGGEHEATEAVAAQSLHGSVHAVDKVEILECCVYALVGRASGVSLPARDDMEAHGDVGLSMPVAELVDIVLLELNEDGGQRPRHGGGHLDDVLVPKVDKPNIWAPLGDTLGDSLKNGSMLIRVGKM